MVYYLYVCMYIRITGAIPNTAMYVLEYSTVMYNYNTSLLVVCFVSLKYVYICMYD